MSNKFLVLVLRNTYCLLTSCLSLSTTLGIICGRSLEDFATCTLCHYSICIFWSLPECTLWHPWQLWSRPCGILVWYPCALSRLAYAHCLNSRFQVLTVFSHTNSVEYYKNPKIVFCTCLKRNIQTWQSISVLGIWNPKHNSRFKRLKNILPELHRHSVKYSSQWYI